LLLLLVVVVFGLAGGSIPAVGLGSGLRSLARYVVWSLGSAFVSSWFLVLHASTVLALGVWCMWFILSVASCSSCVSAFLSAESSYIGLLVFLFLRSGMVYLFHLLV